MLNLIILDNIKGFFKQYHEITFNNVKKYLCTFISTKLCNKCADIGYDKPPCKKCAINFEYIKRNYDLIKKVNVLIMDYINLQENTP